MAAVKVQEQVGIRRTVEVARRLGVESPLGENLSIALGTSDLTLLELTSAYGTIANQGAWMRPTAIRYVLDAQRKLLEENAPQGKQVLSPRDRLRGHANAQGDHRAGHRRRRQGLGAARGGENGHDQRLLKCVVRGLHPKARHEGMGRL